jgi:hypothetical protein
MDIRISLFPSLTFNCSTFAIFLLHPLDFAVHAERNGKPAAGIEAVLGGRAQPLPAGFLEHPGVMKLRAGCKIPAIIKKKICNIPFGCARIYSIISIFHGVSDSQNPPPAMKLPEVCHSAAGAPNSTGAAVCGVLNGC